MKEHLMRFGGEDARPTNYEQSRVVVVPLPYEGTVSYGEGASRGPDAILQASSQLEMYDEELEREVDEVGLFTLPPVVAAPGDTPESYMQAIHQAALPPAQDGKLLLGLGGEHSVTYGLWTALLEARGGKPFSILQLDAHADLRPTYHDTPHSHACIMARAHELGLPFVQVGIRSLSAPEARFLKSTGLEANMFFAHKVAATNDERWMEQVLERLGDEVFVTFDIDGLDPSLVPGTGTPEPGGLQWYPTLRLLRQVATHKTIIGMDINEVAPIEGSHASEFVAARLAWKMVGYATHPPALTIA